MKETEQARRNILRFMRSRYKLDELTDTWYGAPCVKFRQGKKTILTVILQDGYTELLIIFGKAEREAFDAVRHAFPETVQKVYDETRSLHDGKWMIFRVDKPEDLEPLKRMIAIKKKPNRKPVFSKCGMRCDLCHLYRPNVEKNDRRSELCALFAKVWDFQADPSAIICDGCACGGEDAVLFSPGCETRKCVLAKGLPHCGHCGQYPCAIFPAEPSLEELVQKIEVEHRWTWEEEALMLAYDCQKNMDEFRKESHAQSAKG